MASLRHSMAKILMVRLVDRPTSDMFMKVFVPSRNNMSGTNIVIVARHADGRYHIAEKQLKQDTIWSPGWRSTPHWGASQ